MRILDILTSSKRMLNEIETDDIIRELDPEQKRRLQGILLDMFLDIYEVCKKYRIPVALAGGSALGAARHHGFIPWDDDLDLIMPRAAYNRFRDIFEEELSEKYILNAPNYRGKAKARLKKIQKKGTYFEEVLDCVDKDQCKVFLDIFIMEYTPDNLLFRKIKGTYCNILEYISGMVFFYENADDLAREFYKRIGKMNYLARMFLGRIFSFRSASRWFDLIDKSVQHTRRTTCVSIATGRKRYFGEILEKSRLFPLNKAEFEGVEVPVFKDLDYYLRNLYGDYMQIPPLEKREKHFVKKINI